MAGGEDSPLLTVLALDTTLANNWSTPELSIGFFIISAISLGNDDSMGLLFCLAFSMTSNKSDQVTHNDYTNTCMYTLYSITHFKC